MSVSESAVALQSFVIFGDLLKYLHRRARLTQRELSIAVGYSEAQISRLEQNLRPPDLAALAALFIPALYLENEPEIAVRLLELAAAARGESLPPAGSITITRSVAQEITETVETLEDSYPNNLPLQLTSFVGREPEMAEIKRWLVSARLVTLTGAGGSGKTRLALEVAEQLLGDYQDGVWLVELASLSDPQLVAQTVAAALGVRETPEYSFSEALAQFLRRRRLLLALDNCEHVVDAAARLADSLLRFCPKVTILATSREALNIPGEVNYHMSEGLAYLEKLLVKAKEQEMLSPSEVAGRAKALWAVGGLAWSSGDPATGQIHLEESVRLWRQLGPAGRRGLAEGLRELGIIAIYNGDLETAQAALEESIQLWREMGAKWELALALYNQGLAYETRGEFAAARLNYEESLAMFRALNENSGQAVALFGLGHLAGRQGDYATALPLLEECLALHRGEKDSWGIAEALCLLGEVWQGVGDYKCAARFYGECLSLNKEMGDIAILKLALHNLGKIAKEHSQLHQAARLFGATQSPQPSPPLSIPWSLTSPASREQDIAAVRAVLGEAEFAAQMVEWETSLEWAITYAAGLAALSIT